MYSKKQRAAALCGIILQLLVIIALVVTAVTDPGGKLFKALLFTAVALPILLWIYIWLFGKITGRSTMADFNIGRTGSDPLVKDDDIPSKNDDGSITISKKTLRQSSGSEK